MVLYLKQIDGPVLEMMFDKILTVGLGVGGGGESALGLVRVQEGAGSLNSRQSLNGKTLD